MKKCILVIITLLSVLLLSACGCNHEWKDATCSSPKLCVQCGVTEGTALVHAWKDATCTTPKQCLLCGLSEGEPSPHNWIEASCTSPKICFNCNKEEGVPLGHSWEDATCIDAKRCLLCRAEEGSPLGHSLTSVVQIKAPSCTEYGLENGTCTRCEQILEQQIPTLDHTPSDWKITKEATYDRTGEKTQECIVCKIIINTEEYELTEEEKENWYKKACENIKYTDFARNPEEYNGRRMKITGEVFYILDESDSEDGYSVYLVYTKKLYGIFVEEPIVAIVKNSETRLLTGDIITMYGELDGLYDAWGEKNPKLNVVYYDLSNSKW